MQDFPFFIDILRRPVINWVVMELFPAHMRARFVLRRLSHDDSGLTEERISRHAEFVDQASSYGGQMTRQFLSSRAAGCFGTFEPQALSLSSTAVTFRTKKRRKQAWRLFLIFWRGGRTAGRLVKSVADWR
ncbi:MAG: hypothetical protein A2X66_06065 [Ignavibacteria bacterium GWA2_54_16]|nr:MAG: hypothetical protein A2X66_06065 [Ignavibacteria bacterium GWA2_54_16]